MCETDLRYVQSHLNHAWDINGTILKFCLGFMCGACQGHVRHLWSTSEHVTSCIGHIRMCPVCYGHVGYVIFAVSMSGHLNMLWLCQLSLLYIRRCQNSLGISGCRRSMQCILECWSMLGVSEMLDGGEDTSSSTRLCCAIVGCV